jgi:hypothetical protein
MKKVIALVCGIVALTGCAGQASEDDGAEGATEALSEALDFNVFGFASEKKTVEYTTRDRLLGTARPDDRMKEEMLPRVRAAAATALAESCASVTGGAGRLQGNPRGESVRAERIYYVTEFIVEVRNTQTCSAPRDVLAARVPELMKLLAESGGLSGPRMALVALKETGAAAIIAGIEARIRPDGTLDTSEDTRVTNWTVNYVIRLAQILKDMNTTNPRALPALRALKTAVSTGNGAAWATGEVDRVIAALPQ